MSKVDVYYNLHKKIFSVRYKGIVILHSDDVFIKDAEFVVQPAGRAKVLTERKKNVHAFVRGTLSNIQNSEDYFSMPDQATYNPYKYSTFVNKETEEPLYNAKIVHLKNHDKPEIYYQ